MECNYLSLPLIPASVTILLIYSLALLWDVITCPCPWYLLLTYSLALLWNVITCPCPWYLPLSQYFSYIHWHYYGMQLLVPALDTCFCHNTSHIFIGITMECNYLSLPLIPASATILLIYSLALLWEVITCPCPWYLLLSQYFSLSGVPDYFGRNKISSGGDLSHYSSASLY